MPVCVFATLTDDGIDSQSDTADGSSSLPDTIRYPTNEHSREEFYKTMENVRYVIKITLNNGAQAEDVPVGIKELIEFIGDVEIQLLETPLAIGFFCHN